MSFYDKYKAIFHKTSDTPDSVQDWEERGWKYLSWGRMYSGHSFTLSSIGLSRKDLNEEEREGLEQWINEQWKAHPNYSPQSDYFVSVLYRADLG